MKPFFWALTVLLLYAVSLTAQPTQAMTLEDCLNLALLQNPGVENTRTGMLIPDHQRAEVRAGLLPQINANANYQYYLEVPRQMVPVSAFGGPEGQYTAARFGVPINLNTSIQVTQVLYSPSLNLALSQVETGRQVAQLQWRNAREEVAYNVSAAFFNAQVLAKQIDFLKGNLASLEKVAQTTRLLADQQLATPVDVQRLQLQQENLQNRLQNLREQHDQTLRLLQLLMGIPQTETILLDTTVQIPDATVLNRPEVQRTELQLLEKQKNNNILEQQRIRAGGLPTVMAFGSYNYSGFGKFGDNSFLKYYPSSAIGLSAQWSIFDGQARRARLSQKNLEFQQLERQYAFLRENIAMETANARNQILSNRRLLAAAGSSVRLADKVLQQTTLQLREGLADITDLLNAENALREAQINYLNTLTNLRNAQLEMDKATGHLLD